MCFIPIYKSIGIYFIKYISIKICILNMYKYMNT